uniref:rRNA-processing protein n=1 Tax=Magnetococcus massalia (strain MO-1) TaxID=451514 RepID=A0A1S7LFD8_MAGMO|nr:protein of unknown function [Candidatus Magnetococcus massalia]
MSNKWSRRNLLKSLSSLPARAANSLGGKTGYTQAGESASELERMRELFDRARQLHASQSDEDAKVKHLDAMVRREAVDEAPARQRAEKKAARTLHKAQKKAARQADKEQKAWQKEVRKRDKQALKEQLRLARMHDSLRTT